MIYGASSVDGTTTNTTSKTKNSVTDPNEAQDRFLKLLVAQLKDPSLQSRLQAAQQELKPVDRVRVQRKAQQWKPVKES